ncbi:MAG: clostripain-related cysteine peptidase, partial [Acidobacteriota bacterium]|nr:clostripain-related cysteine peptidase [Acidobacteriota bacterium]
MSDDKKLKEWTVMFFFAGDNSLSPLIVSQLKAIKDAGFHPGVNVLAHYDSNEPGVPIKILNVNRKRIKEGQEGRPLRRDGSPPRPFVVGDNRDPFILNMADDTITSDDIDPDARGFTAEIKKEMDTADSVSALKALKNFIGFCGENYKAKNYLLFLVGHGLVVGRDTFLPDDNPASSVKLSEMRGALERFNEDIAKDGGTLQLLALHSCSMSAAEVAYELRGQAKYMMSSEGISYIGSWPYRQLLMKLFRNVIRTRGGDPDSIDESTGEAKPLAAGTHVETVDELMKKLFDLTYNNAKDFALSGYSLDLS